VVSCALQVGSYSAADGYPTLDHNLKPKPRGVKTPISQAACPADGLRQT
jgi:hypothetical protein